MTSVFRHALKLESATGDAPLFPLPNVVLFPHVLQPLHIFEPRYRQMVADTLQEDGLIAMALLKPGWERLGPEVVPPIHQMVCVGRIIVHEQLPDGRYNLIVQGVTRALLTSEEVNERPYRIGRLRVCPERAGADLAGDSSTLCLELLAEYGQLFPHVDLQMLFQQALGTELPLGTVCDLLASVLPFGTEPAQRILEELDIDRRRELLLEQMRQQAGRQSAGLGFPPDFSAN